MGTLEWIIWSWFVFMTACIGLVWFIKQRKQGAEKNEEARFVDLPRIIFWETIVLVFFAFVNINKLNLLWIYPAVLLIISVKMVKQRREHCNKKQGSTNKETGDEINSSAGNKNESKGTVNN